MRNGEPRAEYQYRNITTVRLDVVMVVRFRGQYLQYMIDMHAALTTSPLIGT